MTHERVPLTALPRELRNKFGNSPSYNTLYMQVLDGKIPAEQQGRRWFVLRQDLDKIGEIIGLRAPKMTRPSRKAGSASAVAA